MKFEEKNLILRRPYKSVYHIGDTVVKVFDETHPKANVFNEAFNTAKIEEAGLSIPKVISLEEVDGKWALAIEYKAGKTLEKLMEAHPDKRDFYLEKFVEKQVEIHKQSVSGLKVMKEKFSEIINNLKILDATVRYELLTRLESMPKHKKICHGDFVPSNIIVDEDDNMTVVDWAHVTVGNASGDAAITYLNFAITNQELADKYLKLYCQKSDTALQYVRQWLPIVAAVQLSKDNHFDKDFLMKWIDVMDFQ